MFRKIFLEITNVCNLTCSFCPPPQRAAQCLTVERFDTLLSRLEGWGKFLYFHVKGEPFLHPQLDELLALAGDRGFQVNLTTNGTLLADRVDEVLGSPALRQINVSLHSHSGLASAEYWTGLEVFLDRHARQPRFPVSLRVWTRRPGEPPEGLEALWQGLERRYPVVGPWERSGTLDQGLALAPQVFLNFDRPFVWPHVNRPADHPTGRCHGLVHQIGVLADGTVVPCCLDGNGDLGLGNLFETPLGDILKGPLARTIAEGLALGHRTQRLCQTCNFPDRLA